MTAHRKAWVVMAAGIMLVIALPATAGQRVLRGEAIYYSDEYTGSTMACGGTYHPRKMIAAHRKLPCGTVLRVKNRSNGLVVKVTVRDRGPYGDKDTILDVSRRAARKLDFITAGRIQIRARIIEP